MKRSTLHRIAARLADSARTQASPRAASSAGATLTGWSDWSRAAGVEYRYRRGVNPQEARSVDAVFQVRSLRTRTAR
jgi:hypothetical protein